MRLQLGAVLCGLLLACNGGPKPNETETSAPKIVDVEEYHENGAVKMRGKTVNGERQGMWESYYPTGYKWSETTFANGRKEGLTTTYYPNGMMRYTGHYYDDERTGLWIFYDTLGGVIQRIDMDRAFNKDDSLLKTIGTN